MGLFVLAMGKTALENIADARANLDLIRSLPEDEYLIGFAIHCLEMAREKCSAIKEKP